MSVFAPSRDSFWLGALLVAGLLATGCGDDNGDGGTQQDFGSAQLQLEAVSSTGNMSKLLEFQDPAGTLYTLTSLRVAVEEIELDLPDGVSCGDFEGDLSPRLQCNDDGLIGGEDQLKVKGPFVIDVLQGTTSPDISELVVPAVDYTQVDLEVDTARVEDQTVDIEDDIIDQTVVAFADFEFENQKRELKLEFSFKAEAKASANGDTPLQVDSGDTIVLQLDVANWLTDIPVTGCLQTGDLKPQGGQVVIDDEAIGDCADAEAEFESNFEDSLRVEIERAADPQ